MNKKKDFRSGFLAILGRPNVGKSTLLNTLIGEKISIISPVPQTTRYQIRGILNLANAQAVFVDTPGIHSFSETLARHLNTIAKKALAGCDLILYVTDTSRPIGKEEGIVMDFLLPQKIKLIMVLNKIDLGGRFINDYIDLWRSKEKEKGLREKVIAYLPLSAKTGKNAEKLKELIVENLPLHPPFYEQGRVTDFPLKFRLADIIREKLCLNLKKELPHSIAVSIESIEKRDFLLYIRATIYANRTSQKKIIIGAKGAMLKAIGEQARRDIEKACGAKVYLDMWVKVLRDWQESVRLRKDLGYWWT